MRLRFNTIAPVTAKHLDERFATHSRQLAHGLHFSAAILALAGIPDSLGHPAVIRAKPVGKMKICP
jgi:hypothetical protein